MSEQNILATVAGANITDADVDAFIATLPGQQQAYASNPQFRKQCLDQVIAIHLFAKYGEEIKLEETAEFQEIMEKAMRDIYAQLAMKKALSDVEVTEEEARAFYAENPQHFRKSDCSKAAGIEYPSYKPIGYFRNSLRNGIPSAHVSRLYFVWIGRTIDSGTVPMQRCKQSHQNSISVKAKFKDHTAIRFIYIRIHISAF